MTRIVGLGQIGFQSYVMIPIGGKSIKQGGDSFLGSMVTLYQEVQKESKKRRQDQRLKEISQRLLNLLSAQKIEIYRPPVTSKTQQEVSYLSLGWEILSKLEKIDEDFEENNEEDSKEVSDKEEYCKMCIQLQGRRLQGRLQGRE